MYNIGEVLAKYRKEAGLSQVEVSKMMDKCDCPAANKVLSAWEKGKATPNPSQFLTLCKIYKITDIYSAFIGPNPDNPMSKLSEAGKEKVMEYIELLKLDKRYTLSSAKSSSLTKSKRAAISHKNATSKEDENLASYPTRELPLFLLPASAGTGEFLDGDSYDMVVVGSEVPESASFGLRLNGDSMMPRYVDGQIVWVYRTTELMNGDIGIFYLDGNAYCKRLHREKNLMELVSINPAYAPIPITEESDFRIYGRVVS
ncbi:MAG: LexA family transcriptional regulator [Lachnospiraceae bacterium]|nr:LexA family transcriptional regulator [Lachnospiraceae bacterium]